VWKKQRQVPAGLFSLLAVGGLEKLRFSQPVVSATLLSRHQFSQFDWIVDSSIITAVILVPFCISFTQPTTRISLVQTAA
jgi:hypothetical protein